MSATLNRTEPPSVGLKARTASRPSARQVSRLWLVLLALLLRVSGALAQPTHPLFQAGPMLSTVPVDVMGMSVGDATGDGRADVVVAGQNYRFWGEIIMLTGQPDGRLILAPIPGAGGAFPGSPAIGDFDGDGRPDIAYQVAGDPYGNPAHRVIHLAQAGGGFDGGHTVLSGSGRSTLGVADLSADGRADFVLQSSPPIDSLIIAFGGDGLVFARQQFLSTNVASAWMVDWNADSAVDLVAQTNPAINGTTRLLVFTRSGDWLQLAATVQLATPGVVMAIANLDGDLRPEVLQADGGVIRSLKQNGEALSLTWQRTVGSSVSLVDVGDVEGDGAKDIVFACSVGGVPALKVLSGQGDGDISHEETLRTFVYRLNVADVTGDGVDDIVYGLDTYGYSQGAVATIVGGPRVGAPREYSIRSMPYALVGGDFNGDGTYDLMTTDTEIPCPDDCWRLPDSHVSVLLGLGDGGFHSHADYDVGYRPTNIAVADLDNDGNDDAIVDVSPTAVLFGSRTGAMEVIHLAGLGGSVGVGDLDGDGLQDIVVGENQVLKVLRGRGGRVFDPPTSYTLGFSYSLMTVADVNQDGLADILLGRSNSLAVLVSAPGGIPQPALSTSTTGYATSIVLGHVDSDPFPDVVLRARDQVGDLHQTVLLGMGNGFFSTAPAGYLLPPGGLTAALGDFNLDGRTDALLVGDGSAEQGGLVRVLLENASGGFDSPLVFGVGPGPIAAVVRDLNHDGRPDVAVACTGGPTVAILDNLAGRPTDAHLGTDGRSTRLKPPRIIVEEQQITVRYVLPHSTLVQLSVFDVRGRLLRRLGYGIHDGGEHTTSWDGLDRNGLVLARGIYIVTLRTSSESSSSKFALLR